MLPADDPRHQLGDHLLVAEPVLHADHGRVGQGRPRRRRPPPACAAPWWRRCRSRTRAGRAASVLARTAATKSASPVTRRPPRLDRVHVLGPGVDGPHLDAGHARQVGGVQAADRAAADDGDAHGGRAASRRPARSAAMSAQTAGSPPPTPRPATTRPPITDRQPAGHAEERRRLQRRQRRDAPSGSRSGRRARRCGSRTAPPRPPPPARRRPRRPRRRPSGPAAPGRRRGRPRPPPPGRRGAAAASMARVAEPPGPVELGPGGSPAGAGAMPRLSAGVDDQVAEALLPARLVVAVLPDVRDAEGVGDQQVLGVGRLAVGAHHLAGRRPSGRNGLTVAPEAAMPATTTPPSRRGSACRPRRGTAPPATPATNPAATGGGDRRHPVQVLGARDLLRRRDPGLGPGARHPARPAARPSGTR